MREQLVTRLLPVLARKPQEEFNVFDVMRYGGHERQLSDVFAWLLDAGGTHKLGDAFLRIFIDEVNRGMGDAEPVAHGAYGVRQEVNTASAGAGDDIADLIVEDEKPCWWSRTITPPLGTGTATTATCRSGSAKARGALSFC